jgi:hypothetical protein
MTALNRNPENTDLLQSTKFRLTFDRLPGITYFCQVANFPGVSLTEVIRPTPFVDLYTPGEKLIYDTFNITFFVDEDLRSWLELHDWMRGLTFPTDFKEYVGLSRTAKDAVRKSTTIDTQFLRDQLERRPQYGNAILTIYTNKNNPNIRVKFFDIFPTSLSTILFNVSDTAENIAISDATFRFAYYDYDRLRGSN